MALDRAMGLMMVGLDNHVGYLLHRRGEVFFIHSSYCDPVAVVCEVASQSDCFSYSSSFYIAPLSDSPTFLEQWLNEEEVTVVMDR